MSIYYHEKINCKILRSTPKAHLIQVSEINDVPISRYTNLKKYLIPLEIWCPKTWFKKDFNGNGYIWIWGKGFRNNINKLIEKRRKNDDDKME